MLGVNNQGEVVIVIIIVYVKYFLYPYLIGPGVEWTKVWRIGFFNHCLAVAMETSGIQTTQRHYSCLIMHVHFYPAGTLLYLSSVLRIRSHFYRIRIRGSGFEKVASGSGQP